MATPVEREYSPDAKGKFGLLTFYEDNKSQETSNMPTKKSKLMTYSWY